MTYAGIPGVVSSDEAEAHLGGNHWGGDPFTFAPSVWRYLIDRFAVTSVMDLGSGLGYAASWFHKAGLQTIAIDGLSSNVASSRFPAVQIDLTKQAVVTRVDLVHSQELVEHIHPDFIDNLMASLTCGQFAFITHALPGQGGHHHANEQPTEYWVSQFARFNYNLFVEDSNRTRELARQDGAVYAARTGLVFCRNR